jgi:DNA-binding NtrC family response regulator
MPSILIVDDEGPIRTLLAMAFSGAGYSVRTAANATEALALCEREAPDAMLSDVMMPGMNGHELAQSIAQCYPETRTVLMSGFDLTCLHCAYSPRCALLHKPFRPSEAIRAVERALSETVSQRPASRE